MGISLPKVTQPVSGRSIILNLLCQDNVYVSFQE